jgi:TonB family protein
MSELNSRPRPNTQREGTQARPQARFQQRATVPNTRAQASPVHTARVQPQRVQTAQVRPSQAQLIAESRQPARLVLALVLLLVAFGGVIAHDRNFWFGSDESKDTEFSRPAAAPQQPAELPQAPAIQARSLPTTTAKKAVSVAKNSSETTQVKASSSTVVSSNRTAAPLDVEVVAGDSHRTVHPGNVATKVELTNPGSKTPKYTAQLAAPTNAAELERVNSLQPTLGSGDGSYPLLAQQMKVQGSVVLQAFIGADGVIENLRVVSGPSILASAAQQAVREWRFKPYMQNGQPVETKATITVNFTIKVADNTSVKTS